MTTTFSFTHACSGSATILVWRCPCGKPQHVNLPLPAEGMDLDCECGRTYAVGKPVIHSSGNHQGGKGGVMSDPRPPRSFFHHLSAQQLYHLDQIFAAGGGQLELARAARRYGLTRRQVIEAVSRYRGYRHRRTPRSQR